MSWVVYWNLYVLVAVCLSFLVQYNVAPISWERCTGTFMFWLQKAGTYIFLVQYMYIGTPVPWERGTEISMFWVRCTGTWNADGGWLGRSAGQQVPADWSARCPGRGQHAHRSSAGDQPTLSALSFSYLDKYRILLILDLKRKTQYLTKIQNSWATSNDDCFAFWKLVYCTVQYADSIS